MLRFLQHQMATKPIRVVEFEIVTAGRSDVSEPIRMRGVEYRRRGVAAVLHTEPTSGFAGLLSPMRDLAYDPYRHERQLVWRNRVADWRARADEAGFHLLALLALTIVAALSLGYSWPSLMAAVQRVVATWPTAATLLSVLVLTELHAAALRRQRSLWSRHWLVAQPIKVGLQRRILQSQTMLRVLMQLLLGGGLLCAATLDIRVLAIWTSVVMLAAVLGWRSAHRAMPSTAHTRRQTVFTPRGRGSFLTWQCTEAIASLAPYRVSRLIWLLLLVPRGQWLEIGLALVLVLLGIAFVAWSRSLAVLPAAERWLLVQPLPARSLLLRAALFPALLLAVVSTGLMLLLLVSGHAQWAPMVVMALLLPALLHFACSAAERRRPSRIGMLLMLHLTILAALLQAMPLLLLPIWLLQMFWLLRKALRS